MLAGELGNVAGILLDAGRGPMELQKQRGRLGMVELGVLVDRAHHRGVQQLAPRDRYPGLHRGDRRRHGRLDARQRAHGRRHRLGDGAQAKGELVIMPSVPSEPMNRCVKSKPAEDLRARVPV